MNFIFSNSERLHCSICKPNLQVDTGSSLISLSESHKYKKSIRKPNSKQKTYKVYYNKHRYERGSYRFFLNQLQLKSTRSSPYSKPSPN